MLCATSFTNMITNQVQDFSCQWWCYTHTCTHVVWSHNISYYILCFLERHGLRQYTRELIQFVKGRAHHQFIEIQTQSGTWSNNFWHRLDLPVYTHIISIKLLIIYVIVTTSLMSGPPYQYLVSVLEIFQKLLLCKTVARESLFCIM